MSDPSASDEKSPDGANRVAVGAASPAAFAAKKAELAAASGDDGRSTAERETAARAAWFAAVRRHHASTRALGIAGCLIAAAVMLWAKFDPAAPPWVIPVGLAGAVASWGALGFVAFARYRYAKQHPYRAPE